MGEIINHNCHIQCADICSEKTCGELATHFIQKEINGLKILISMCEKHYEDVWVEDIFNQGAIQ